MDFKFSKEAGGDNPKQAATGEKGRQNALLVVLLVLVGGFAYLYFFTGLIRPQEVPKTAEAPVPQVVKKPLPARDGDAAKVATPAAPEVKKEAGAPAKPEPAKVAPAAPATPTAPVAKTAPVAPVAKVAPKPREEPAKALPAKPAEKKAQPAPAEKQPQKPVVAKAGETKPAPVAKKQPAMVQKKVAPTVPVEKKMVVVKKPTPKPVKKIVPAPADASGGRWTVVVGNYLLEDALAADMVRVRKAGLEAAVQPGAKKKTAMNRLLRSEYDDRDAAKAELDKLKRHTSDAFIIEHGGKYAVYAGSYLLDSRALSEKERLAGAGFSLTVKRVEVAIPSKRLTAGTFSDAKSAESVLKKLKDAGLKASLSRQ